MYLILSCFVLNLYRKAFQFIRYEPSHGSLHGRSLLSKDKLPSPHIVGFLFFLWAFFYPMEVASQETIAIEHIESFSETSEPNGMSLPIAKKEDRLKSGSRLTFQILYDENVPDTVVKCLQVAADIWRSCLNINANHAITLQLAWEDLPNNEDIKNNVQYVIGKNYNLIPSSLYYSVKSNEKNNRPFDAKITINKNLNWDCGYNVENKAGVRNLSYAMLRSIAVALGFGSTLTLAKYNSEPVVKFQHSQGHSLFENMLVSEQGIWLKDQSNTGKKQNPKILDFCTGVYGDVYISGMHTPSQYKMYTPASYEDNKSLMYLDNKQSLMHYSLDKQTKKLQIDTLTTNVLNKMGWDIAVPNSDFQIIGEGIAESGVTSAYTAHSFHVEGNGKENIKDARWYFYLPSVSGSDSLQKSAEGTLAFNINAISDPDNFVNNVSGDIYGQILFSGTINGIKINLQYNVTLELKPSISSVSVVKRKNDNNDSYDAICKVDYKGADYLYVSLEEYGSSLRSQFVREPYLAHFVCSNITSPYYAWIDIKVENKYGSEVYTVELPPYYSENNKSKRKSTAANRLSDKDYTRIKIWDIKGHCVKTVKERKDIGLLESGIYILEYYQGNAVIKTSKLSK